MNRIINVALVGNPNSGKTTIFNAITGSRQRVGNYPGVTVERKQGTRHHRNYELRIMDLPGMYDLTPQSPDESVARDHLLNESPDVVVCIVDCTNLERNLYLAVQLRELGVPLALAFNMSDVAVDRGIRFDLPGLSKRLGVPIVPTVGHRRTGVGDLLDQIVDLFSNEAGSNGRLNVHYGPSVEAELEALESMIVHNNGHTKPTQRRWQALKLLEQDPIITSSHQPVVQDAAREGSVRIRNATSTDAATAIVTCRYAFISDVCAGAVERPEATEDTRSARIDRVLTHRLFGLPIFFGLMYLVFQLTFTLAAPFSDGIEAGVAWISETIAALWPGAASSPLMSLIVDGAIGGVGAVLVFLPNIVLLFMAITIIEDSGYMARAAFMMDRLMSRVGLHGKSFIPMLLGFGCNVPAIMATRTLESRRDRMTTMLILPLMSCSARLTIYALVIPAFFARAWQGPMLWIMYLTGIVISLIVANLLRSTVFAGEKSAFLMELPTYHRPSARGVLTQMWSRAWLYVKKAGTIILGASILLWTLAAFPQKKNFEVDRLAAAAQTTLTDEQLATVIEDGRQSEQLAYSAMGRIGHVIEPVIRPMGFDWKIGTALIGAFAAKEVFVAQMGVVYSVGQADESSEALRDKLRQEYTPLVGFCILLFSLIATPCLATVAIMKRESNSWTWALLQFGSLTAMGYVLTTIAFQAGRLLGIGI